jgi:hypothetical protein
MMSIPKVVVESATGERLAALPDQVMLCDAAGRAIGIFIPVADAGANSDLDLPLSLAESRELRKGREGKPLEDILNRLGLS